MAELNYLDAVYTATPFELHTPILLAGYARRQMRRHENACLYGIGTSMGIGGNIRKNRQILYANGKLCIHEKCI